jgi:two-component SAPR family response regulator
VPNHIQCSAIYFTYNIKRTPITLVSGGQSILIVDDELDIVESIKMWLQKRGLEVQGFTDPLLALDYFKNSSNNIDIVLSDIRMPQMNGCELVKRIRNLRTEVKIILMSAFEINHAEMKKVLPDMKIDGLISKPISLRNLSKIIDKNLNKLIQ